MQAIECKSQLLIENNSFFGEFSDCRMAANTDSLSQTPPYDKHPMVNTLGTLTAIVLAFSAFVAHKNKGEFKIQVAAVEKQNDDKTVNTETFKGLLADIAELRAKEKEAKGKRDGLRAELEKQTAANDAVQAEIDNKQKELDSTKNEVTDA